MNESLVQQSRGRRLIEAGKFIGATLVTTGAAMVAEARYGALNLPADSKLGLGFAAAGGIAIIGSSIPEKTRDWTAPHER